MPNDVTWQSTGPLPQCWFGWHVLSVTLTLYLVYAPISSHYRALFPKSRFSPSWMAYRCNFSKHTSQILLAPSKTPGGTLA